MGKRTDWTRSFWAKAAAFTLAAALAPFACLCGASLAAAYAFGWWTGWNEEYQAFYGWAQGRYWTMRGVDLLYALHRGAIPLLAASLLLLLFLAIYLARAAARHPGREDAVPGWQEKLPFDLYLLIVGTGAVLALFICDEAANAVQDEPVLLALVLFAAVTVLAVLLLAAWMTFCARVKLGNWWRNTVTFWALTLCLRFGRWCVRRLRGRWRGVRWLLQQKNLPESSAYYEKLDHVDLQTGKMIEISEVPVETRREKQAEKKRERLQLLEELRRAGRERFKP